MTPYRTRRATSIENEAIRVTVLHEGGHIAEITDTKTGINPLWTPPWPSIEPSAYDPVALLACVDRALRAFEQPKVWGRLMNNAMRADFSWDRSARAYLGLYERLVATA